METLVLFLSHASHGKSMGTTLDARQDNAGFLLRNLNLVTVMGIYREYYGSLLWQHPLRRTQKGSMDFSLAAVLKTL